jgi:hypothetical protein
MDPPNYAQATALFGARFGARGAQSHVFCERTDRAGIELVLAETGRPAITRELVGARKNHQRARGAERPLSTPGRGGDCVGPRVTINLIAALHFFRLPTTLENLTPAPAPLTKNYGCRIGFS